MGVKLKPLDQQVIVITGASSGIGLATAETAAKQGAKVVLAARSDQTLNDLANRINAAGGEAIAVAVRRRRPRARSSRSPRPRSPASAASTPG